jgi:phage shock protein E
MSTLLTAIITFLVIAALWHGYEYLWDRKLFGPAGSGKAINLSAQQAAELLQRQPELQILDVRSPAEFAAGALPGAQNAPLGAPDFEAKTQALDPAKPLLIYCAGGYRSRQAIAHLLTIPHPSPLYHLHRGYMAWRMAGAS